MFLQVNVLSLPDVEEFLFPSRGGVWGTVVPQVQWYLAQERPNKSTQLTGHGHDHFLPAEAALHQSKEATMQPDLCFPTQLPDPLGLVLLAFTEFFAHFGRESVVLSALDQKPASMGVAALGDGPRCWRSPVLSSRLTRPR